MLTKRNLFIILGVVIAAEIVWAGWTILKSAPGQQVSTKQVASEGSKQTTVTLTSDKASLKLGEKATVSIRVSSASYTDGADLIIIYDPKLLSAKPVSPGTLYSDYPQNVVDEALGRITVSGITGKAGGVFGNGLFGSLEFTAKAPGLAKISLDFTPGETGDSNVTESGTGKDILEKVNSLELNIQ